MGASTGQRIAGLVFVGAVTGFLLALLFAAAGLLSALEIAVYALATAAGLEFLISSWPSIWGQGPPGEEQPER
jgi:hypothetical protein